MLSSRQNPVSALGVSAEGGRSGSPASTATGEEAQHDHAPPTPSPGGMRRNMTATATLSSAAGAGSEEAKQLGTPSMRRNTSASALSELRRREQQPANHLALEGSCAAVVEAVACKLLEQVLGKDGMLAAMRENMKSIPEEKDAGGLPSGKDSSSSSSSSSSGGGGGSGSSSNKRRAAAAAAAEGSSSST